MRGASLIEMCTFSLDCMDFILVYLNTRVILKYFNRVQKDKSSATCTYLRLKVRRSSLALSRSLTANVALPRKQLCKQDSKLKVDITVFL